MSVNVQVTVVRGDVPRALRRLRKKVQVEGITYDIKRTEFHLKPSEARAVKRRRAATRARKLAKRLEA
jgi:ribosomal protein S21